MKKYFLFFITAFLPLFSNYDFFVQPVDLDKFFQLKVRTFEDQLTIVPLVLESFYVIPAEKGDNGLFILNIIKDPNGKHLNAIGPNKGVFTFQRSVDIPDGEYNLIINNVDYGFLNISEEGIFLNLINCL